MPDTAGRVVAGHLIETLYPLNRPHRKFIPVRPFCFGEESSKR
jgi:hypothetical protein